MNRISQTLTRKHFGKNKLLLGVVGIGVSTIVGTAGMAAAAQPSTMVGAPTAKEACAQWQTKHFKNYGQCVSAFEHDMHDHGHGYGSGYGNGNGNNVSSTTNVNVNGDGNVVSIVINYLFG